ncbi:MAG: hypothetical protein Q8R11_03665 [bacterium]|nr:hypothetical protein [bacterium]
MNLSAERLQGRGNAHLSQLAAENDTSRNAIHALLDNGVLEKDLSDVLEVRGFLSRDGVSITARGNRANDIVSCSAVAEAYRAVNGDIEELRRLAELTLRHVTSRSIFMRGAFTRGLHFAINEYMVCGKNFQILEESFENGSINPFPDVLHFDTYDEEASEFPLSDS